MTAPRASVTRRIAAGLLVLLCWLVLAAGAALWIFLHSERVTTLASHDATVRPTLSGRVVVATGPVLPDVRLDSGSAVGAHITLGKTEADTLQELVARYGAIAAAPEGQADKVRGLIGSMALSAGLRGAVVGLVPVAIGVGGWLLAGPARRRTVFRRLGGVVCTRRGLVVVPIALVLVAGAVVAVVQPWDEGAVRRTAGRWVSLSEFVGTPYAHALPPETSGIQVRSDVLTRRTRKLVDSAIGSYLNSQDFYAKAVDAVEALPDGELRQPDKGESVVVLVSDRHDNIGMDKVVRALADRSGATAVFDAGDDTSTGSAWEDFSLDSLDTATKELDQRWAVAGNHDHGDFTTGYLDKLGWDVLDGEVVEGPGGGTLLGVPDPRSSGLGAWRDTPGMSFSEAGKRLADVACDADGGGVDTLLVHDANLGREALRRGCAELVLGGHVHVASGPEAVVGENGETGYTYTTGTTGGAAYAFALGKPRRTAQVTLVTYDGSEPAGLQAVELQTNGRLDVHDYEPLSADSQ